MLKKNNIFLVSLVITIGILCYLTAHHFSLKVGDSGSALCSISSSFNCDAASSSSYSELFGIPIAILGSLLNLFILGFALFYRFGWIEESAQLKFTFRSMLTATILSTLIYGLISLLVIKVICPFCLATYILSFINFFLGWNLISATGSFSFTTYFSEYKSHLIALACVPFFAWSINGILRESYKLNDIAKQIPEKLAIWKNASVNNFDLNLGISNKVLDATHVIVEFADFKCPHCMHAAKTIETFLMGNKTVQYIYKPFPLDGICNDAIQVRGDGSRCDLAAVALCGEIRFAKGIETIKWLFEHQIELYTVTDIKSNLEIFEKGLGFDKAQLLSCITAEETFQKIKQSAAEGVKAKVEGTPAIFMDGRILPGGQFLEILQAAAKN
jgi:uncharacterized membrane protein